LCPSQRSDSYLAYGCGDITGNGREEVAVLDGQILSDTGITWGRSIYRIDGFTALLVASDQGTPFGGQRSKGQSLGRMWHMKLPDRAQRMRSALSVGVCYVVVGVAALFWSRTHPSFAGTGWAFLTIGVVAVGMTQVLPRIPRVPRIGRATVALGLFVAVGSLVVGAIQAGQRGTFEITPSMPWLLGGSGVAAFGGWMARTQRDEWPSPVVDDPA